jgi:hypothetical protein
MPLPLTDPRWSELRSSYGGTKRVVNWLTEAYRTGGLSNERLGDLINEVQHQGRTSSAMYAVVVHLIELARLASTENALTLLTHAGLIYANSDIPGAVQCPKFLREEFIASASHGAKMLSPLLPLATDFNAYRWAVAALAGLVGHHGFARFLEGLDEGQFYLDEPVPKDG